MEKLTSSKTLRKSGIGVLGDVPQGSRFITFYQSKQDLFDIVIPFFKAGLDLNEYCLWLIPGTGLITAAEAQTALKKEIPDLEQLIVDGKMEILEEPAELTPAAPGNSISRQEEKLARALASGYSGMRISCNQFQPDPGNPANHAALEKELSDFIDHLPIIALYTALLSTAGTPELFDAPRNAQPGIIRQQGQWIIFGSPEQIKTHGEIKELNESFKRINRQFSEIPEIMKYLVTILSVSGSLIIAHWLNLNGITTPTSIFFCGIMLSTWYGGARQGLLAIALSLIDFKFYFVPRVLSFSMGDKQVLRLFIFTFSAVFVVWFCAVQRNISNSLRRTRDLLNATVQKLRHSNLMLKTENTERKHAEKLLHAREQEFQSIINARKEMEDKLRESKNLLAEAEQLAHIGSWSLDIRTGYITWSDELCRIFGIPPQDFDHRMETVINAIHPDEQETVRNFLEQASKNKNPQKLYHRILRPDGEERIIHYQSAIETDDQGKPVRLYGATQDVTESRRSGDKLRLACQRLFYHFENTPLGVIEFDKDLVIKKWSKRAEEIFGWTAAEALGKSVYDADIHLIYNEDKPSVDSINLELTGGLVNRNMSMNRNYTKQGNTIYCEWYNSVLRNEQGHVTTILSLAHDVSERELAEQNLNKSNQEITRLNKHLQNIREVERDNITREIHRALDPQLNALKMEVAWIDSATPEIPTTVKRKLKDISQLLESMTRD